MMALIMRLSILVRIIPGNLGVQEWFSGGSFYLLGGNLDDGLMIALFIRFSALLITFSVGIIAFIGNMKYFKFKEIRKLWRI